jgi:hypothetical protein
MRYDTAALWTLTGRGLIRPDLKGRLNAIDFDALLRIDAPRLVRDR